MAVVPFSKAGTVTNGTKTRRRDIVNRAAVAASEHQQRGNEELMKDDASPAAAAVHLSEAVRVNVDHGLPDGVELLRTPVESTMRDATARTIYERLLDRFTRLQDEPNTWASAWLGAKIGWAEIQAAKQAASGYGKRLNADTLEIGFTRLIKARDDFLEAAKSGRKYHNRSVEARSEAEQGMIDEALELCEKMVMEQQPADAQRIAELVYKGLDGNPRAQEYFANGCVGVFEWAKDEYLPEFIGPDRTPQASPALQQPPQTSVGGILRLLSPGSAR